jgi:hypothetical protein
MCAAALFFPEKNDGPIYNRISHTLNLYHTRNTATAPYRRPLEAAMPCKFQKQKTQKKRIISCQIVECAD